MSIVLMYHRVAEADIDPHNLAVSPANFREHLAVLRKLATPRRLLEIVDNWSHASNDVGITFDDGYADNFYEALPALETEDIPATMFLSTGMLDQDGFWVDRLARCLLIDHAYPDAIAIEVEGREVTLNLRSMEECRTAHRFLHSHMRIQHPDRVEKMIKSLVDSVGIDPLLPQSDRPLTSIEATQLASHPLVDLGGHTVRHCYLSSLSMDEQRWEIETCKDDLKKLGVVEKPAFAYPFGDPDCHTFVTRRIVRQSGWHHAVVAYPKQNWWFSRYAVPRIFVGNWNGDDFERRFRKWLGIH